MNKYKYHILGLCLLLTSIAVTAFMLKNREEPKSNNKKVTTLYVQTIQPTIKEVSTSAFYRGRVSYFNNVTIASEVSGKIERGDIDLKEGIRFKKGDILFHIYDKDERASLMASKSSFLQILANILPSIKMDYPSEYTKWNLFFDHIKLNKQLPELPEFKSKKERIFMASQNVLTSYYNLVKSEITLSKYTVYAPFNGSIASISKEIGDIASNNSTIAKIVRTDRYEVTVPVLINDYKWMEIGDKAKLTFDNGTVLTGKVVRIADIVDETTQSVNIFLHINNFSNTKIMGGEYIDVTFNNKVIKGMLLPREALINNQEVYQLKNKKLTLSKVKVLRQLSDNYMILPSDTIYPIVTESISEIREDAVYSSRK